jgi:ribose-phosphate pyrophosphokinase
VIIFDDMIDTAGTLTDAVRVCSTEQEALSVTACCTHPVLSGKSLERINDAPIKEVVVSNTVPFNRFAECPKIRVLDMSMLLAEAIERIHLEKTVSALFV